MLCFYDKRIFSMTRVCFNDVSIVPAPHVAPVVLLYVYMSVVIYNNNNKIKNCKIFNSGNLKFSIMSMIMGLMILYCLHSQRLTCSP